MGNVIIEHADGRRYSTTRAAHKAMYPDFDIVGEETDADFDVIGVPQPRRPRPPRRQKAAKPIAKPPEPED